MGRLESAGFRAGVAIGSAIALVGILIGVAVASIPASNGTVSGCYSTRTGALRVIDYPSRRCATGEKLLRWNQTGPAPVPIQPALEGSKCTLPEGGAATLKVSVDRGGAVTLLCYPVIKVTSSITLDTVTIQDLSAAPDATCTATRSCSVGYAPGTTGVHIIVYASSPFAYQCPGSTRTTSFYDTSQTKHAGECVGLVMDANKTIAITAS